jgi:hypothetical protein
VVVHDIFSISLYLYKNNPLSIILSVHVIPEFLLHIIRPSRVMICYVSFASCRAPSLTSFSSHETSHMSPPPGLPVRRHPPASLRASCLLPSSFGKRRRPITSSFSHHLLLSIYSPSRTAHVQYARWSRPPFQPLASHLTVVARD